MIWLTFSSFFFLEITLVPPKQGDIANFQPNSMKSTSNTQYHETFKKIKTNIEPNGNVMYWKLAYFKLSLLTFSKSYMFSNFSFLLQKCFKETKQIYIVYFIYKFIFVFRTINLPWRS